MGLILNEFTLDSTLHEVLQKAKHPYYDRSTQEHVFKVSAKKNKAFIYTSKTICGVKLGFPLVESTGIEKGEILHPLTGAQFIVLTSDP
eukprot:scaffold2192_cov268-Chaetoceros_neogracile.AAC.79